MAIPRSPSSVPRPAGLTADTEAVIQLLTITPADQPIAARVTEAIKVLEEIRKQLAARDTAKAEARPRRDEPHERQ